MVVVVVVVVVVETVVVGAYRQLQHVLCVETIAGVVAVLELLRCWSCCGAGVVAVLVQQ